MIIKSKILLVYQRTQRHILNFAFFIYVEPTIIRIVLKVILSVQKWIQGFSVKRKHWVPLTNCVYFRRLKLSYISPVIKLLYT